ncbi:anti-sigma factor, partial [Leucobacter sp. M11]|uniref:anti-sigma factor n=1 Tax=Leucobacter sp. M11 TaxID=2993565 RepID=UPI002D8065B5
LRRGLTRRKRRQRFFAGIVAIALLLGVGSGALLSVLNPGGSEQGTTLEQVEGAEDGMRVTAQVPGGGEATLSWSARQGQAVLITEGMSAPDGGGSYELWLIRDATATSAGTFVPEEGLSAVPIMGVLAPGDTVIVTEEAADGSATGTPSTEPLLTFAVDAGERTRGDSDGIPA